MTKAIMTKYIGPGNVRGSRIKASDGDGNSVTVAYNSAWDSDKNHANAASDLLARMGWTGKYVGGHMLHAGKSGVMVWVCVDESWAPTLRVQKTSKDFKVTVKGVSR